MNLSKQVLSNIHTIQAHVVGKDDRTWIFEDEPSESVSILDFSEFFVRYNLAADKADIPANLGILFELSIYCKINVGHFFKILFERLVLISSFKKKSTNEECDICCGWSHLPFFDHTNKQQIVNKSYDLPIRGGPIIGNINKPILTNSSIYKQWNELFWNLH